MRVRGFFLFVLALFAPCAAMGQAPAAQIPAIPAGELSPATVTLLQQRAEAFLRELYAWGPEFQVKTGGVKPSPVPNLYEITVEVSLKGQSDSTVVYLTKDGRYMVRGEIADTSADPFAPIREQLVIDGSPSKGATNAPVVIVEFGDFQCPSCRQLDLIFRRLLPEYPQVRLVFKDFPLEQIHPWAMTAALVGRCAYQQGNSDAFWKVHDLIYDNQEHITPDTAYERLLQLAADAGLNPATTRVCVSDPKTAESIRSTMAEGAKLGVNSTPTSFINGREVVGPNEALLRQYLKFISSN